MVTKIAARPAKACGAASGAASFVTNTRGETLDAGAGLTQKTSSNSSVTKMVAHNTRRKCSATWCHVGVSSV